MAEQRVSQRQLWSWVDREAPELQAYLDRFPDQASAVDAIRQSIQQIAEAQGSVDQPDPERIDAFMILERIGEGGQGVVYRARQESPPRVVALKVMRRNAIAGRPDLIRFQREVHTLARLDHPGIATIHTAGITDDGHPWFAMELIDGVSITEYVQTLPAPDRVRLCVQMCDAVHFAHQQGVVHRDLKPSNILVSGSGQVHLVDFGLARPANDQQSQRHLTRTGQLIGTLAYMSPEQVSGLADSVSPASDTYALGVILFEVITDQLPYDLDLAQPHLAATAIVDTPPRTPRSIRSTIDRDLQIIMLKAIAKEPARRYASADALARDLDRYLQQQPILARPTSAGYQLQKLMRRHRLASGLAAAVLVLVVVLGVVSLLAAARIAEERDKALAAAESKSHSAAVQAAVNDFLFNTMIARGTAPDGPLTIPEALHQASTQVPSHPDLPEAEIEIHQRLALAFNRQSSFKAAERHYGLAADVARRVFGSSDHRTLSALDRQIKARIPLGEYESALALLATTMNDRRVVDDGGLLWLQGVRLRGAIALETDQFDQAEKDLVTAIRGLDQRIGPDDPETLDAASSLAATYMQRGRYEDALGWFERILATRQRIHGDDHLFTLWPERNVGNMLYATGRYAEAEEVLSRNLERTRQIQGQTHFGAASACGALARALAARGHYARALPLYEEAVAINRSVRGDQHRETLRWKLMFAMTRARMGEFAEALELIPSIIAGRRDFDGPQSVGVIYGMLSLAETLVLDGQLDQGRHTATEALDIVGTTLGDDHPVSLWGVAILGRGQWLAGDHQAAIETLEEGHRRAMGMSSADKLMTLRLQVDRGVVLARIGELDDGFALVERGRSTAAQHFGPGHPLTVESTRRLAELQIQMGRADQAEPLLLETLRACEATIGADHYLARDLQVCLSEAYQATDRPSEAEGLISTVLAEERRRFGDEHPRTRAILAKQDQLKAMLP